MITMQRIYFRLKQLLKAVKREKLKSLDYSVLKPIIKDLKTSQQLQEEGYIPCDGRGVNLSRYPGLAKALDYHRLALENWRNTRRFAAFHKFLNRLSPRLFPNVPKFELPDLRGRFLQPTKSEDGV